MRYVLGALLLLSTAGCPSSGTLPGDGGLPDPSESGVLVGDSGLVPWPKTSACTGDPSGCLSGTAKLDPLFSVKCISAKCTSWQVGLYRLYPAGGEQPVATQLVAMNDSWAFSGFGPDGGTPWSHYYVQAVAVFDVDGGQPVGAVVGPLTVPASNVAIVVRPLQATALESRLVGGSAELDWVLARLFDPTTGAEITSGAQASVTVGGAATPLAPTQLGASGQAYFVQFAQPPPAQPSYAVTAAHPSFGDAGLTVQLVADPPAFDASIGSIDAGSGGLTVAWAAEPQADYEVVELYASTLDGGWVSTPTFVSPSPDPPDQTSETFSGVDAGKYLVNVAYTKANCPADAGGCVQASTVAAATVTVP